jgi:hypothetical protein
MDYVFDHALTRRVDAERSHSPGTSRHTPGGRIQHAGVPSPSLSSVLAAPTEGGMHARAPSMEREAAAWPAEAADDGTLDLDAHLGALQSGNPLEQLRSLRELRAVGLLSEDVMRARQDAILDCAMDEERGGRGGAAARRARSRRDSSESDGGGGGGWGGRLVPGERRSGSPGGSAGRPVTPPHGRGAAGRSVSHDRQIVEERLRAAGSPGHVEVARLEPALNSGSEVAVRRMSPELWVDPRPHDGASPGGGSPGQQAGSPSGGTGGRRRRGSDVSPKPTEVPLEDALYALDQVHDTAHIVKRAIEARSRTSLW